MISFVVPGQAVQFARAGSKGARRFTPAPQRSYMNAVANLAFEAMDGLPPTNKPVSLQLRVEYLVPESWPQKRKAVAKWKTSAPDADNLAKIVKDALNAIVYIDDALVVELTVQKVYGLQARSTVVVTELDG